MLGVESVQFSLHQVRKVKLQHFLSRTVFDTHHVRGKQRTVFLTRFGIFKLQHFFPRTLFGTHHVKGKERTVFLTAG